MLPLDCRELPPADVLVRGAHVLDPPAVRLITSAESDLAASSNELRVRVEAS